MQDHPCPVCSESAPERFKIWFDGYLKLYRCASCSFVAQYPGPGKPTLVTDYSDRYTLDFVQRGQEFMYPRRRRNMQDILARIVRHQAAGQFLDVGCGDGHFLSLAASQGFQVHGVEDSEALSAYAAQKTGAKVLRGQYSRDMFQPASFNVISMIQVLEHIPDPLAALQTMRVHLQDRGIIAIEVPSITAPNFLAYRLTGAKWFVRPPHGVIHSHCNYFSPASIRKLMTRAGFNELALYTGRWRAKYSGALGVVGSLADPIFQATGVGGILYLGRKSA